QEVARVSCGQNTPDCPQRGHPARFQASLSFRFTQGTVPAQPSIRFFSHETLAPEYPFHSNRAAL
ncbi:hypothetical protein KGY73_02055, partial [bacterium]|nr:hypothetical protein [bacterium]